jgi:hypothetical protein
MFDAEFDQTPPKTKLKAARLANVFVAQVNESDFTKKKPTSAHDAGRVIKLKAAKFLKINFIISFI